MIDHCNVCAGAQGPDHKHVCNNCGGDADTGGSTKSALVYGGDGEDKRFYCDGYCADIGEDGEPSDVSQLVDQARKLKVALAAAGLDWRKV